MIQFVIAKESEAGIISDLRRRVWATVYRGIFPDNIIDQSLYVLPAYQRQGIGKMVFQLIRDYCKHDGIDRFICHCQPKNVNAQAFYRKMGGKIIARDEGNEEHWQDSVTFEFEV